MISITEGKRVESFDHLEIIRINLVSGFKCIVSGRFTNLSKFCPNGCICKIRQLPFRRFGNFKNADIAPTSNPYSYKKTTKSLFTFSLGYNDFIC